MNAYNGRIALVTGASAGIGAGVCESLVKHGMTVIGTARSEDKIQSLAAQLKEEPGKLVAYKCDVTNDNEVYGLFEHIKQSYGGVDVLVNNAGAISDKNLLDDTPDAWRNLLNLNVVAPCLFSKLAAASMFERDLDDGYIIFIGSDSGHFVDKVDTLHFYDATKFAIRAIAEGLRREIKMKKTGMRVSVLSPGYVATNIFSREAKDSSLSKEINEVTMMTPDDMGSLILHMITSPARVEINDVLVMPTHNG